MRLTSEPSEKRLSFRQIADEWAREDAGEPGAFDADEIHQKLVEACVLGDFEDDAGEHSCLKIDRKGDRPPMAVTRRMLAAAMPPVYGLQMPPKSELRRRDEDEGGSVPWDDLKPRIPFDAWARVPLAAYERYFRAAWLEKMTISKTDFRSWCLTGKYPLPRFWFTDDEIRATSVASVEVEAIHNGDHEIAQREHLRDLAGSQNQTDESTASVRQKQKANTLSKYQRWYDSAQAIKADPTRYHSMKPGEIAGIVARQENVKSASVRRRLNEFFPGWATYK